VTVDDNIPHGLEGYRRYDCKCGVCRAANTKYGADRRARIKAEQAAPDNVRPLRRGKPMSTVDVLSAPEQPGFVEQGVIDVCVNSSVAAERPDVVAQARVLARLMDTQKMEKDYTSASRQLSNLMGILCPVGKSKTKGRLVQIQKMTNRRPAQGSI